MRIISKEEEYLSMADKFFRKFVQEYGNKSSKYETRFRNLTPGKKHHFLTMNLKGCAADGYYHLAISDTSFTLGHGMSGEICKSDYDWVNRIHPPLLSAIQNLESYAAFLKMVDLSEEQEKALLHAKLNSFLE